ncbi:maternal effect embryo arrest 22 [Wolffia australiana]
MSGDVVLESQTSNRCCAELRKRYARLEEKRNALRQAVKLLESQTNKLEEEKIALTKAHEEERARAELADNLNKGSLEKKLELEKEIRRLKSEIVSLEKNGKSVNEDRNLVLLSQVAEGKAEIKRLNELILKEINRGDLEKKKVEEEKNKAAEAWKLLKMEKNKANEEKQIAEQDRKKGEEWRREAEEAREKILTEQSKLEATKKKLQLATKTAIKEKKRADSLRVDVEEKMRLIEIERRKLTEERAVHDQLSGQLHEERQKLQALQKKIELVTSCEKSTEKLSKIKPGKVRNDAAETEVSKLLRDKIKFQKQQLKHVKEMLKQRDTEKHMLLQQLCLLKQDHVQFSHRLEMLTSCFPYILQGDSGINKVGKPSKKPGSTPQRTSSRACRDINSRIDFESVKNMFSPRGFIKSVPGTSSDLESSPVRHSVRDKSQSSVICSTDVTFSDTQTVGSQGRSGLAVATSTELDTSFQISPALNLIEECNRSLSPIETLLPRSMPGNMKEHASMDCQLIGTKRKSEELIESGVESMAKRKFSFRENNYSSTEFPASSVIADDLRTRCHVEHLKQSLLSPGPKGKPDDKKECEVTVNIFDGVEHSNGEMDYGKFMKLLDFDDEDEERRYQEARTMLLSPNLPIIRSPDLDDSQEELKNGSNEASSYSLGGEKKQDQPCPAGISYRNNTVCNLFREASESSQLELTNQSSQDTVFHVINQSTNRDIITVTNPSENQISQESAQTALISSLSLTNAQFECDMRRTCNKTELDEVNTSDILEIKLTSDEGTEDDCSMESQLTKCLDSVAKKLLLKPEKLLEQDKTNSGDQYDNLSLIVSSFLEDEKVFCRILYGMNATLREPAMSEENRFMLTDILALNPKDLSAEEKVSVICSLLVNKTAGKISIAGDIPSLLCSFIADIERVMPDKETRLVSLRTFPVDIFIRLLQDFISGNKIMVCQESSIFIRSDFPNVDVTWIRRPAHPNQFISACVILAATSSALGCTDILWQTLYQLLESDADDNERFLKAARIFESACQGNLFSSGNSSLLLPNVITSIISLLEKRRDSGERPFGEGKACSEKLASLLLKELRGYFVDAEESAGIASFGNFLGCNVSDETVDSRGKQEGVSCRLRDVDPGLCHFCDVLSLVELAGKYMGWQWLRSSVIPQLFKLVESCSSSRFSAPVLVLIGQLIRIGMKSDAAQVEEDSETLVSSLSRFLEREREGENSGNLAAQISAVEALLCLLPLDFREIIDEKFENGDSVREKQSSCMQLIRRWFFSGIGRDHMAQVITFFEERV